LLLGEVTTTKDETRYIVEVPGGKGEETEQNLKKTSSIVVAELRGKKERGRVQVALGFKKRKPAVLAHR